MLRNTGIDRKWPTAELLLSSCAVLQEVSRKPELTNSNKWRHDRKLKVIRVKNVFNHKRLWKTILWSIGRSWLLRPFIYSVNLFGKIHTLSQLCNTFLSPVLGKKCSFVFTYSGTCNLHLHSVIIQKLKIYNLTVNILNSTLHKVF